MRLKRLMATVLTNMLVLQMCGCAAFGAPATTEELLVRYVASEDYDNFRGEATVGLSVNALGVRATIPIATRLSTAGNVAHGNVEVDLSALDTRTYEMELYAELLDDALNCYIGTPSGERTSWKLWKVDMTSKIDIMTVTELLSASELTLLAKDSDSEVSYELSVPTAKVLESAFDVAADAAEVAGMDEDALIEAVGGDKVRVGFTQDCLMRSIDTGVMLTFQSEETNKVQVRMGIDISATLEGYGTVDPSEVAIPDEVREEAVPTEKPVDIIEIIGADSPLAGAVRR